MHQSYLKKEDSTVLVPNLSTPTNINRLGKTSNFVKPVSATSLCPWLMDAVFLDILFDYLIAPFCIACFSPSLNMSLVGYELVVSCFLV
jgi:hypothetical protein